MIDRFKNFNEEMTKMKSLYNDIILINKNNTTKNNNYIKENDDKQINELNLKLAKSEQENNNLKERIE